MPTKKFALVAAHGIPVWKTVCAAAWRPPAICKSRKAERLITGLVNPHHCESELDFELRTAA